MLSDLKQALEFGDEIEVSSLLLFILFSPFLFAFWLLGWAAKRVWRFTKWQ